MRRRSGFTIIELMVAMALIVFIMAILAEAFVEGLKTFRNMKAVGDMNSRLRMARTMMSDDLSADHLEGKRRLSDPGFWSTGPGREGFFRVWHGSQLTLPGAGPFYKEGAPAADADGVPSYYATDHFLQLTAKKRGNNRKDFYSAQVPSTSLLPSLGTPDSRYQDSNGALNTYTSQWVEVAWYMRPNGAATSGLPLFTLYRHQRVIVPSTVLAVPPGAPTAQVDLNYQTWNPLPAPNGMITNAGLPFASKPDYLEVSNSYYPPNTAVTALSSLYFNNPRDLTIPQHRFGMFQGANSTSYPGWPSRSDGALRYPIYASPPSPNYMVDDEDSAAAVAGNSSLSKEGTDVILTDVISFAVIPIFLVPSPSAAATLVATPTEDFPPYAAYASAGISVPAGTFPAGVSVFDTWSTYADDTYDYTLWDIGDYVAAAALTPPVNTQASLVPNKLVMTGIQISIRVWDNNTKQTRQITIIQDL